ncbi:tetratricopeptide repeat protein [Thalassotalea fonticola]|uniref:Tetratricopeptide repeat protein n=1 Tax=Thalassotalea fonticola TaxID=3065649 RepID=A0ABZ0GSL9_9GAMM|nr:tetratricopeptide repeat protein [Colwelliaceae bacterium S1-1]
MNKKLLALSISTVLSTSFLSGCILVDPNYDEPPARQRSATLASLDLNPSPMVKAELPSLSLDELAASYQDLLKTDVQPEAKAEIQQRIAVLEVMRGEQAQMNGSASDSDFYATAIASLERFIEQNPNGEGSDKLLYQLAKAYDLQGETDKSLVTLERLINEHPNNAFMVEVQFRRAEILFSNQDYFKAISSYGYVIEQPPADVAPDNDKNPYYKIALYMRGWSYFKLEQHQLALNSFSQILDDVMPYKVMLTMSSLDELVAELEVKDKQLTSETFAVMTLIFSSGDGEKAITEHYQQLGIRPYEHLNYQLLGDFYLEKQRYSDTVAVYNEFISHYPNHQVAPLYSIKKMEALQLGRFPTELRAEKVRFVNDYQLNAAYWQNSSNAEQATPAKNKTKAQVTPVLIDILQELAQNAHANAQQQSRLLASGEQTGAQQQQAIEQAYRETAHWYEMFLANFPTTNAASNIKFYLAESFYETGQYLKAINFYQDVAYGSDAIENNAALAENQKQLAAVDRADSEDGSSANATTAEQNSVVTDNSELLAGDVPVEQLKDHSAEAAYALILTFDKLIADEKDANKQAKLQAEQRTYKAQFIASYSEDSRAANVQKDIFQQYFKAGDSENAIMYAKQALASSDDLTVEQRLSALLVIGHSQFAEDDYSAAEKTYEQVISTLPAGDNRASDMQDRLAASIYRQGELAANSEPANLTLAVKHFSRVIEKTPNSKIRINAQYDMATHLLTLQRYQQAIDLLVDFKDRYPNNTLTKSVPPKLAFAYQETEQWQQAAAYLKMSWAQQPEAESTRQMLWLSAELYLKAGNKTQALRAYRTYAHTYKTPFATAMEAKHKMSEFYQKNGEYSIVAQGDEAKLKFWLQKIIDGDKDAGAERSARSRYLAADASMYFADETMAKFKRVKLTLPLNKSLAKKRQLLEQTLTAYNNTANYKVAEFTTVASYRIGEVYSQLAQDLMASQRPANLNELELEQYEILLEEQSFPFEDKAIAVHEANANRSHDGVYDQWVKKSFADLARLLPGRYNKEEQIVEVVNELY